MKKTLLLVLVFCLLAGVTAAYADGKVMLYSSMQEDQLMAIEKAFEAAHPDIDMEYYYASGGKVITKVTTEAQAGKIEADVIWTGDPSDYEEFKKAGKSPAPARKIAADTEATAPDADVILLMGGDTPPAYDWDAFLSKDLNRVVASTILSRDAASIGVAADRFAKLARELTADEREKIESNKRKEKFRAIWIGIISLLVTVIGIANAMLMSVTERFREIGTMKCLGALSSFVTQMFVMEASLMGLVGGFIGAVAGALFAIVIYTFTYGASLVFGSLPLLAVLAFAGCSVVAGVVLSVIAALYPARVAAAMVPATALRSTI